VVGVAVAPAAALVAGGGGGGGADWIRVARVEGLEPARPTKVSLVGPEIDAWTRAPDRRIGAVWLIRDSATAVRAFSSICPHLGCGIDLSGDHFVCPCHDTAFDLRGGHVSGPSPRGMDPLEVRIADGWVSVRYERFQVGVAERRPA
jgi:Rieske Fe-S protein